MTKRSNPQIDMVHKSQITSKFTHTHTPKVDWYVCNVTSKCVSSLQRSRICPWTWADFSQKETSASNQPQCFRWNLLVSGRRTFPTNNPSQHILHSWFDWILAFCRCFPGCSWTGSGVPGAPVGGGFKDASTLEVWSRWMIFIFFFATGPQEKGDV